MFFLHPLDMHILRSLVFLIFCDQEIEVTVYENAQLIFTLSP
jgi:hypothetical protein